MRFGTYAENELQRIKTLELEALRVILSICQSLELQVFLIGGSALGAVRHGGFIPWDDDIDVGMLREDYDAFLQKAPALLPRGYALQAPRTADYNPYPYAKLRIDGTRFVEYCNHTNRRMHQGVYVDIFPFDEVPDDEQLNLKQFRQAQRLMKTFTRRQSRDVSRCPETLREKGVAAARICLHYLLRGCTSRNRLLDRMDRVLGAYNGTGQAAVACLIFPKRKCEYVLKTDLFPLRDWEFEGIPVKIPNNYDAYLTTHYGNYRKLPPVEEQVGHRPYQIQL